MFKTPPPSKEGEAQAEGAAGKNSPERTRFGSTIDLSRTINVQPRPDRREKRAMMQSPSLEMLNAQLEKNEVSYELPNPRNTGTVPKGATHVDTTVPPPNVANYRSRNMNTTVTEELQSFITMTISETQKRTRNQLSAEIANAVQVALEENIERLVERIRTEVSRSPSRSTGSISLDVLHEKAKGAENNAYPVNERAQEASRQPPPSYENANVIRNHPDEHSQYINYNQQGQRGAANVNRENRTRNQPVEFPNRNPNPNEWDRQNNYQNIRGHTKIADWGISYEGPRGQTSVEDFVFRVEYLQNHYRCPWQEVLRDFHRLLNGEAKDWYWLSLRSNPYMAWPQLKECLLRQFRNTKSDFEMMRNLVERRQNAGETIDEYFLAMIKLRSMLRVEIGEPDMIKIIKRNVRDNISRMIYAMQIWSVEHLREECKQAEEHLSRNFQRNVQMPNSRPMPSRQVQSVYFEENCQVEEENQVE